jgi:hypothetical protein
MNKRDIKAVAKQASGTGTLKPGGLQHSTIIKSNFNKQPKAG